MNAPSASVEATHSVTIGLPVISASAVIGALV